MSLSIDIDRVSDVLLADGWHRVIFQNGESTFLIDAYEYIQRREGRDLKSSSAAAVFQGCRPPEHRG
jgi:hypothetical protein